jgi:hypothetical protein
MSASTSCGHYDLSVKHATRGGLAAGNSAACRIGACAEANVKSQRGRGFISSGKVNSDAAIAALDAAVAISLALQHGVTLVTLRDAMKRNEDGTPQGVVGAALDQIDSC